MNHVESMNDSLFSKLYFFLLLLPLFSSFMQQPMQMIYDHAWFSLQECLYKNLESGI